MRRGCAWFLSAVGVVLILAGCSSSPPVSRHTPTPQVTTPAPTSTATPAPVGTPEATPSATPVVTPAAAPAPASLSSTDLSTMTSVYISYRDSAPGEADLFATGSVTVSKSSGAGMPEGGEWAYVLFTPSPTATFQDQVEMQEGTGLAYYIRVSPNSPWLLRGVFHAGTCVTTDFGVPQAVLTLWGMNQGVCS